MRRLCWFLFVLLVAVSVSLGQVYKYQYKGPFPDTSGTNAFKIPFTVINVGLGVDPAGKVWVQAYGNSPGDSITEASGTKTVLRPIYVFNANGTQASFSPIKTLTAASVTDTLFKRLGYGGNIDPVDGNFVGVWGNLSYKPGMLLWEIDYKTGAGVKRVLGPTGLTTNSPASVAVNQDGEFYVPGVVGGLPGIVINPSDGSVTTQFAASIPDFGRAVAVSKNGNDVYVPRFTLLRTFVYHSNTGSSGTYAKSDSIFHGASIESIAIHPTTGYVWAIVDARSGSDTVSTVKRRWNWNVAYAYNPTTKTIVDSFFVSPFTDYYSGTRPLPRGIAFSPTGDTVYVGKFDGSALTFAVSRFVRTLTSVQQLDEPTVPSGYVLEQNFPNPFNPTTEIQFKIASPGMTSLKVYDVLGREVASLVDNYLGAGSYRARFEAGNLTSGTYIYVLTSGETRISKKMLFMK